MKASEWVAGVTHRVRQHLWREGLGDVLGRDPPLGKCGRDRDPEDILEGLLDRVMEGAAGQLR